MMPVGPSPPDLWFLPHKLVLPLGAGEDQTSAKPSSQQLLCRMGTAQENDAYRAPWHARVH
jgi:hypothetical protein